MKIKVVSRKLIKPSTPTPENLKKYKISFIDELIPPVNMRTVLFYYPSNPKHEKRIHILLEESLSKILVQFYPLAGRYFKNHDLVDCSDQGAEFIHAEAVDDDIDFHDLVSEMEMEKLNHLMSSELHRVDGSLVDPLLVVQATELKCGGLAIGVTVSHRIFDAFSMSTFIAAWSNATNNNINPGGKITIFPSFDLPTLLPSSGQSSGPSLTFSYPTSTVSKKFWFNQDAITSVRSKLITRPNYYYSRVRVVSAIIAKVLIDLDGAKHNGKMRPFHIIQGVNMRGRTIPPLLEYSCGNFAFSSLTQLCIPETHDDCNNITGVQELVDILSDSIRKTISDHAEVLSQGGKLQSTITETSATIKEKWSDDEVNVMVFTDWSKFGLYDVDFGWGKPVGVGIGVMHGENIVKLMGNKEDDGIEAWVDLNSNDMPYFETRISTYLQPKS